MTASSDPSDLQPLSALIAALIARAEALDESLLAALLSHAADHLDDRIAEERGGTRERHSPPATADRRISGLARR